MLEDIKDLERREWMRSYTDMVSVYSRLQVDSPCDVCERNVPNVMLVIMYLTSTGMSPPKRMPPCENVCYSCFVTNTVENGLRYTEARAVAEELWSIRAPDCNGSVRGYSYEDPQQYDEAMEYEEQRHEELERGSETWDRREIIGRMLSDQLRR